MDGLKTCKQSVKQHRSQSRVSINTLVAKLKECGNRKDLQGGKLLHSSSIETGCHKNRYVATALISMYTKCGSMQDAQQVYEKMVKHDVFSCTALMLGYVENGESSIALDTFNSMDCAPDRLTFLTALKACASLAVDNKLDKKTCLQKAVIVHRQARGYCFDKDVFVANTLVNVYSKCGDMLHAKDVFDKLRERDVVSWNALIFGYVENGESSVALDVFNSMDCAPNRVTFVAALKACVGLATEKKLDLWKGVSIHKQARERGFDKHVFVASILVDMYSKCGHMKEARQIFDGMSDRSVVSWTALILGYVENGENSVALDMFNSMDCPPDSVTFLAALKACVGLDKQICLQSGSTIHRQAKERGFDKNVYVASTLVDMYSKCGDMLRARDVFDGMMQRNVVSWTSLILGYVENGESSVALDVFNSMDCAPDLVTFVAALKACASLGALEAGQRIHDRVCELGLEQDETVASYLVDFYGKCGNMAAAEDVFNRMRFKDIVSWTALIGGYTLLGHTSKVLNSVERMEEAGVQMNTVTMLLILTACNHAGTVEEGLSYFDSMSKYGITATMEHYTCMVDMLGRANRLQEALSLVERMPLEANHCVWMTLLSACSKWCNVEIGRVAFRALVIQNDKEHVTSAYVLMRNIYEKLGMREEGEHMGLTCWCDAEGNVMYNSLMGNDIEEEAVGRLKTLLGGGDK